MSPIPHGPTQKSATHRSGAVAVIALIALLSGVGAYSRHAERATRSAPVATPRSAPVENDEHTRGENGPPLQPPAPREPAPSRHASPADAESTSAVAEGTSTGAEGTSAGAERTGSGDHRAANAALKKALDARIQRLELELAAASSAGTTAEANRLRVFIRRLRNQVAFVSADAEQERSASPTGAL